MINTAKIYVAGTDTLIGSAILDALKKEGYVNAAGGALSGSSEPIDAFFAANRPEYVFLAAGKSGGIGANQKYPADLMLDNLLVSSDVIRAAHRNGVRKLLYLASSCCYPRECPQPMRVESLMTGPLEPTNQSYALAKLAGLELCRAYRAQFGADFIMAIPANAYGPGDDFSHEDSHVIAALIRKMHEAKVSGDRHVELWGTGAAEREFIFAPDLGAACVFLMNHYSSSTPINIGARSQRISIADLARMIKDTVGFAGEIRFDRTHSDGMPRKILDSDVLRDLGWSPATDFRKALSATYDYFLQEHGKEFTHA
ncbi:MAG TPA: GDP-L-fucose synthase [Terriglobia bacterium]|nr:GDP-L-fucose synthase [Terriglobia bacterium]